MEHDHLDTALNAIAQTMSQPQLPQTLPAPINMKLHAHDACWPAERVAWWRRIRPWREDPSDDVPMWPSIGWAAAESEAEDDHRWLEEALMRAELFDLDDRPDHDDEVQFESPQLLERTQEISERSLAALRNLVEERRAHAQDPTVLVLPNKPCPHLFAAHPGYTLAHHRTGIMASFYREASGHGRIMAKSYSNPLLDASHLPPKQHRPMPKHFYGYGVGRRLYLAAHALWPDIRWQDGAVRSTSRALRSRLHALDPYVWQDSTCSACQSAWGATPTREELVSMHDVGDPANDVLG